MIDLIKHIRRIHYSLVIVSGTLLYIGVIAGTQYSLLIADIHQFTYYLSHFEKDTSDQKRKPTLIMINEEKYKEYFEDISLYLNNTLNGSSEIRLDKNLLNDIYFFNNSDPIDNYMSLPIEVIYTKLKSMKIDAYLLDTLVPNQTFSLPESDPLPGQDYGIITIIKADQEWHNKDSVTLTLTFEGWVEGYDSSGPWEKERKIIFSTKNEEFPLSEGYLSKHCDELYKFKDEFWSYSIDDLLLEAKSKMGSDIEQKTSSSSPINLLGVQIEGEHIGIVGSLIILITLLYLNIYLKELITSLTTNNKIHNFKPWIGLIDTFESSLVCLISIGLLPAATVTLLLYRFVISSVGVILPGIVILAIGLNSFSKLKVINKI